MKEITANGHKITLFDDIEQISAARFSKFNKFLMLSDSLGNSFEDIDKVHLQKLFMVTGSPEKLKDELTSLRILVYNVINEISPQSMAFAALVESIDNEKFFDLTDDGLKRVQQKINDTGITIADIKKK